MDTHGQTETVSGNAPKTTWDEPAECASPRGWCYIEGKSVTWDGQRPVGFYLVYDAIRGQRPIEVFASRYIWTSNHGLLSTERQAHKVFKARKGNLDSRIATAKRWIEKV